MTESQPLPPDWPTCQVDDGCLGVQLDAEDYGCVHHTTDENAQARWWTNLREGGRLDARGLTFTSDQLQELLDAAPRNEQNRPRFPAADFEKATFAGTAAFGGVTFAGAADFERATFAGAADFERATFAGAAEFGGATFEGDAGFMVATFAGAAEFVDAAFEGVARFHLATFAGFSLFVGATFEDEAWFVGATFEHDASVWSATFGGRFASFDEATFEGLAWFLLTTFEGDAQFRSATFAGGAHFETARIAGAMEFGGATFEGDAWFDEATVEGAAKFGKATFEGTALLAPMLVGDGLSLGHATFASRLDLEVATPRLDCTRSRLAGGSHLRVGWASVDLTEAEIPDPCILEDGAGALRARHELWERLGSEPLPEKHSWTVALGSLRRATVTQLVLGAVDLGDCRFHGAHDLERLRIPHTAQLHQAPVSALGRVAIAVLQDLAPHRHRRQVLAEEIVWRQAKQAKSWRELQVAEVADPATGEGNGLEPIDVAELYRQLRRGREARGDQPGAADFYYGEMEMRRKSLSASAAERRILDAYWLLSGYALRASRALITLAAVGAVSIVLLTTGLIDGLTVSEAFWVSLESVVLRAPTDADDLTDQARNLTTVLRIAGPVLLALAVLSIRGRVKR